MTIQKGDFIRIDYTETVDGQPIAATSEDVAKELGIFDQETQYGPRLIIIGAGQVAEGLEDDMVGKEVGYQGSVTVPPEKAFGVHDPLKMESIPINKFKDERPIPGMRVSIDNKPATITRIIGRKVMVDFNHPLAGRSINFDYKINEKIDDKVEQLKGMVKAFARMDLESKLEGEVATIYMPWELSYYKEWAMIRRGLADMIMQHLSLKEVDYVEKHTGEKFRAEMIAPPKREGEAQGEVKEEAGGETGGEALGETRKSEPETSGGLQGEEGTPVS